MASYEHSSDWANAFSTSDQILAKANNFRDVKDKRAADLDQLYAQASAALNNNKFADAVKLFGALVKEQPDYKDATQKLGVAQTQIKRAPVGVQTFNIDFPHRWYSLDATLKTIEVMQDGRLEVTISLRNNSGNGSGYYCFTTPQVLIELHDQKSTELAPENEEHFSESLANNVLKVP